MDTLLNHCKNIINHFHAISPVMDGVIITYILNICNSKIRNGTRIIKWKKILIVMTNGLLASIHPIKYIYNNNLARNIIEG